MSSLSCPDCASGHTADQRYCVVCGRRLRTLPANVAVTLTSLAAGRRLPPAADCTTAASPGGALSPTRPERQHLTLWGQAVEIPSARALAATVLAVIAFGVIIGTTNFSSAAQSLAIDLPAHRTAAAPSALAATGNTGAAPAVSPNTGAGSAGGSSSSPSATSGSSGTASGSGGSTTSNTGAGSTSSSSDDLPPIKHVWVVELGDQGYAQTLERGSPDTYLNTTLAKQGEVVPYVYASATSDLANEIGLISGQGPTVQTESDCPRYTALKPGRRTAAAGAQVMGDGCVYPKSTPSLLSELTQAHDTWKAYVQGLGTGARSGCEHPALGAKDPHFNAASTTAYETWRNPVVYLAGLTAEKSCASQDTGLGALAGDLKSASETPNVSLILPNACDDGSDTPCRSGAPAGTAQSDRFLKTIIPEIQRSPAYKADGMILITFAQAPQSGSDPDQSSCCDQVVRFPNLPSANYEPPTSPGAGAIGAPSTTTTELGTTTLSGTPSTTTGTGTTATGTETTADTSSTTSCSTSATTTTGTAPTSSTATTTSAPTTTTSAVGTTTDAAGGDCACPSETGSDTATTPTGTTTTTAQTTTTLTGTATTPSECPSTTSTESGDTKPTGGGGDVGLLVLSRYVSKDLQDGSDYFSTFSITGSLEQLFGLKDTGYAATIGLSLFSGFFYSNFTS